MVRTLAVLSEALQDALEINLVVCLFLTRLPPVALPWHSDADTMGHERPRNQLILRYGKGMMAFRVLW